MKSNIKKLKNELALGGKTLLPQPEGWIESISKKKEHFQKDRERMVILNRVGAFGCREDRSYMVGRSTNHVLGASNKNDDVGIKGRFYSPSQNTSPDGKLRNNTVGEKVYNSTENLFDAQPRPFTPTIKAPKKSDRAKMIENIRNYSIETSPVYNLNYR
jgi:hypothetical protein